MPLSCSPPGSYRSCLLHRLHQRIPNVPPGFHQDATIRRWLFMSSAFLRFWSFSLMESCLILGIRNGPNECLNGRSWFFAYWISCQWIREFFFETCCTQSLIYSSCPESKQAWTSALQTGSNLSLSRSLSAQRPYIICHFCWDLNGTVFAFIHFEMRLGWEKIIGWRGFKAM